MIGALAVSLGAPAGKAGWCLSWGGCARCWSPRRKSNLVAAAAFGLVQRVVGSGEQIEQSVTVCSYDGRPDGDGEPDTWIDAGNGEVRDASAEPFRDSVSFRLVGVGQHDSELFAAESAELVIAP